MAERIVRLPKVREMTGLSRSNIYSKIARGEFPRPVALGERAVGWVEAEVEGWIAGRVRASRRPSVVA